MKLPGRYEYFGHPKGALTRLGAPTDVLERSSLCVKFMLVKSLLQENHIAPQLP